MTHTTNTPEGECPHETIEQFLARGGKIIRCESKNSVNMPMLNSMVFIDGMAIPMASQPAEYIPSFVVSEKTYDAALSERMSPEDDGTSATWREYESSSIPHTLKPTTERIASIFIDGELE